MERYQYSKESSARRLAEAEPVPAYAPEPLDRFAADAEVHADDAPALSVLGKTLVFKGELTANEDLLIQGRVEGSITHTASHLAIGAHGDVKADITGRRVIIQGKLEGDVRATESIVVEVSANVRGNLYAPRITLKDGAKFRGSIDMESGSDGSGDTQRLPMPTAKRSKSKGDASAGNVDEILG
jgi:cytoskeletal protein CcmA (bactofilin family)